MTKATTANILTGKQVATPKVIDTALDELHFAKEAPKGHQLVVRKDWPREGRAWDELLASVKRHGVIMPLVFKEIDGKKYVIAGNRRLDVLREIHSGAVASKIITVPTIDVDSYNNGDPRELAYAANVSLPPHAVDRYEVFSMLIDDGMSRADLAARYVLTDRQVSQVLALANLIPEIRDAWRSEEIDAETAEAFTLAPSMEEQRKAFVALKKVGNLADYAVTQRFVGKQRDIGRTLLFVGKERYIEAGGKVHDDLFRTNHTVSDQPLLMKLVSERYEAEIKRLVEVDGWAWAARENEIPNRHSMASLRTAEPNKVEAAEIKKLRKIADDSEDEEAADRAIETIARIEETAELRGYSAADRAKSGCSLNIGDHGELVVRYGFIKARTQAAAEQRKASGEKPKPKKADGSVLSNALAQRLSQQLTQATAAVLAKEQKIALAVLAAGFSSESVVKVSEDGMRTKKEGPGKRTHLDELLATFMKKTPLDALAQITANALDFETLDAGRPPLKNKDVSAIIDELPAKAFNAAMLSEFDAEDYFNGVSGAVCVAAIREMEPGNKLVIKAKAEAAKAAIKLAEKHDWLPLFLRTSHYSGPGAKKGK